MTTLKPLEMSTYKVGKLLSEILVDQNEQFTTITDLDPYYERYDNTFIRVNSMIVTNKDSVLSKPGVYHIFIKMKTGEELVYWVYVEYDEQEWAKLGKLFTQNSPVNIFLVPVFINGTYKPDTSIADILIEKIAWITDLDNVKKIMDTNNVYVNFQSLSDTKAKLTEPGYYWVTFGIVLMPYSIRNFMVHIKS